MWNKCWKGSESDVKVGLDSEEDSSVITLIWSRVVESVSEYDCITTYAISKGLKGISPLKESSYDSEGTIQVSSNGIVLDEIILMLEIVHGKLGGGMEKFPIKEELFIKPTPTSSYGIFDFQTCWILSVEARSDK